MLVDFKARFPTIDSDLADQLVPIYEPDLCCFYGGTYDNKCDKNAMLLLMAHLVVTDPSYTGSDAPTKSEDSKSVGSVSVSYTAGSTGSDLTNWFNSTGYGQKFLMVTASNMGPKFA